MCPAVLKAHSDGTEVAGIDKYFLPKMTKVDSENYLLSTTTKDFQW